MTYAGGEYPAVSGQPPQRLTQYALAASISRMRASCSDARVMMTTLSGRASFITARTSFPRLQVFQYGFDTAPTPVNAPRQCSGSGRYVTNVVKSDSALIPRNRGKQIVAEQWFPTRSGGHEPLTVGPLAFAPRSQRAAPIKQKGGQSDRPSLLPIVRGQPSQGCRRISFLRQRRPFAAVSASQVFVPTDQDSPSKVHPDHVAHSLVSKSVPHRGVPL